MIQGTYSSRRDITLEWLLRGFLLLRKVYITFIKIKINFYGILITKLNVFAFDLQDVTLYIFIRYSIQPFIFKNKRRKKYFVFSRKGISYLLQHDYFNKRFRTNIFSFLLIYNIFVSIFLPKFDWLKMRH